MQNLVILIPLFFVFALFPKESEEIGFLRGFKIGFETSLVPLVGQYAFVTSLNARPPQAKEVAVMGAYAGHLTGIVLYSSLLLALRKERWAYKGAVMTGLAALGISSALYDAFKRPDFM